MKIEPVHLSPEYIDERYDVDPAKLLALVRALEARVTAIEEELAEPVAITLEPGASKVGNAG